MSAVEQAFRKEFINRLDRVVVFRPLTRDLMRKILEKELNAALQRRGLRHRPWAVEWDEAAIDFLLRKGFTPDLGARPLKRAIDRYLLSPLALTIVKHQIPAGDQFLFITRNKNGLDVEFVDPDGPEEVDARLLRDEAVVATGRKPVPSLTAITLEPSGTADEIAFLQSRYDELTAVIEGNAWVEAKTAAVQAMEAPGFWEAENRFAILDEIERRDRIESGLRRAGSLLRRLAGDAGTLRDQYPDHLVGLLSQNLYLLEVASEDIHDGRPSDAIIRISAGRNGAAQDAGAARFGSELGSMYRAWAKKRRMGFNVVDEKYDDESPGYVLLAVASGFGAYTILSGEHGLHVLERTAGKGRKKINRLQVTVEVAPHTGQPLGSGDAGNGALLSGLLDERKSNAKLKIVRRYRMDKSPLVRDSVKGWRTGRVDLVLGGDFDLMGAKNSG